MIQPLISPVAAPRPPSGDPQQDSQDPLLRLAGDTANARVLIVAQQGLDLLCRFLREGCLAATAVRAGDKPGSETFDLVVVPSVAALASPDNVIRLARRSLAPNGRLIAGVADQRGAAALGRRLRLNGFSMLRSVHLPDGVLLQAELRSQVH